MDLSAIRTALAAQITTQLATFDSNQGVTGLARVPGAYSTRNLCAVVMLEEVGAHRSMGSALGGRVELELRVDVLAALASGEDAGSERLLDELVSTGAMLEAIESDQTLGGETHAVTVNRIGAYSVLVRGNEQMLVCPYYVTVWAAG